ncbi:DUF4175 family protein [Dokdonella immobilis]|uniref:DUF4175 domain-containing protein n=1 Tax=Dokdonella immobilis TaxID=578942 RepID=A0A1I5ATZ0_9GAMM|nr:DUF4175 family protein [Dokdonella immobilis]SFN65996.1 hypothetical protein SAMN05216289_14312 [Dokdonella immobilis]
MSVALLQQWRNRVRRRRAAIVLASGLPVLVSVLVVLALHSPPAMALVGLLLIVALLTWQLRRALRLIDMQWVARRFETALPLLEDSTDLLLSPAGELSPLQRLQRERIRARLDAVRPPELRPPWPWRRIALGVLVGAVILSALPFWPQAGTNEETAAGSSTTDHAAPATATRITVGTLEVESPAYTGLAPRHETGLETEAVEGSTLRWAIRLDPQPKAAALVFLDGTRLALAEQGGQWVAERTLSESVLYRIAVESPLPLAEDRLYRLDATVDHAPEIRVIEPDRTLNQVSDGQRVWSLDFEVADDFGLGDARLRLTLAQGSGEQVTVNERSLALTAEQGGSARHRRYRHRIAIDRLGMAAGDDLIVRLEIADNRQPKPNIARSAGYILRWPSDLSAPSEGVEGIVQKVLPAYFRSQRQIIIDTEALIGERASLDADAFLSKSDSIGVDQKILRLRYGQFLGEEFESGRAEAHADEKHDDGQEPDQADALAGDHNHEDGKQPTAGFGRADDILAEYGHTHDHAEAATLLDPETKKILKSALAEMWQAELHLRQGAPAKALPYENRALGFIKQVQQSTRIYLARVGLELPPVDESRRLSGERAGLRDPRGVLVAARVEEQPLIDAYKALQAGDVPEFEALEGWLRERGKRLPDALGLIAAADALRREPACTSCRRQLLDRLWAALPTPATGSRLRAEPDALGRRYLGLLDGEAQP